MLKSLLFLSLLSLAFSDIPITYNHLSENDEWIHFSKFQSLYKKEYQNFEEFEYRFENFRTNLNHIILHNNNASHTFKMAINQFTDLTPQEFRETRLNGFKKSELQYSMPHIIAIYVKPKYVRSQKTLKDFKSMFTKQKMRGVN